MVNGSIFWKLFLYTLPLLFSGILQLLFNTADVVVVGKFAADGKTALAAVGSTGSLTNLIVGLFLGLSVGSCVVLSQALGAGEEKRASDVVHTSILTGLIFGVFLSVVGILFAPTFLSWMNTPDNVLEWSSLYIRIYFIGLPMSMIYNFGSAVLRAKGDTQYPLIVLVISGLANIAFNLISVIGFHMDVAGVAIATVISQTVSAIMVVIHLMKMDDCCRLSLRRLCLKKDVLWQITKVGIPAGIQSVLFSLSNVILQAGVNFLGDAAMAGNTAAGNIDGYIYIACNSVYHAALAFTGQNLGAGKIRRIKRVMFCSLILVCAVGFVVGGIAILFKAPLMDLYVADDVVDREAVIEAGFLRLSVTAVTYFTCGTMEVGSGILRGLGKSTTSMIISLIGSCAFRLAWVKWIFYGDPEFQNLAGLFISYPISWVLTTVAMFITLFFIYGNIVKEAKSDGRWNAEKASEAAAAGA